MPAWTMREGEDEAGAGRPDAVWPMRHVLGAPAPVRALATLSAAGAAACFAMAANPLSPQTPVHVLLAFGGAAGLVAVGVLAAGGRAGERTLAGVVALLVAIISVLVATSATTGGAMLSAYAYVWMTVYTGIFLPRWAMRAVGALVTVGFGVGLVVSGLPKMQEAWVLVSLTVWVFGHALTSIAERARRHADTDHVTGLLNRRAFVVAAEREQQLASRTGAPLAVVLMDLDGFKGVNDRHGHAAGDRLLAELAVAWRAVLRPADVLARHGGDEFALLLPATDAGGAARVLARLRDAHPMAWSAGVSTWPAGASLDDVLMRADGHLYAQKGARRRRPDLPPAMGSSPASEPTG